MAPKQITIKDIAKELNLHHSTVSRALRDDPRINEQTRHKVQECAEQHHYQPNNIAINLRGAKSKTIGIVVPSIHHYFFSQIIGAITDRATEAGYSVLISQSNESVDTEIQNIQALVKSRVAGVIASISRETTNSQHFKMLINKRIPLVFFDRVCEDLDTPKVLVKNKEAARLAVDHLVQGGCSRIAYLGGYLATNVFRDRLQGYRAGLTMHGLPVREEWIVCNDFIFQAGQQGMEKILSQPEKPDAVICVSFELALGAVHEIWRQGLSIPDDISLITVGEEPMGQVIRPGITTIAQPRQEIADQAFQLLYDKIEHDHDKNNKIIWLDTELIPRGSTRAVML